MASQRQQGETPRRPNRELLDELLRTRGDRLLRQARLHSERAQDADDALADACIQFLVHFVGEGVDEAERWMLVVVRNCARSISRKRRERNAIVKQVPVDEIDRSVYLSATQRGPEQLLEAVQEVAAFAAAFTALKQDERRALTLLALGHSYSEIEELCGWTYSKVHRCLREGRSELRRILRGGANS